MDEGRATQIMSFQRTDVIERQKAESALNVRTCRRSAADRANARSADQAERVHGRIQVDTKPRPLTADGRDDAPPDRAGSAASMSPTEKSRWNC